VWRYHQAVEIIETYFGCEEDEEDMDAMLAPKVTQRADDDTAPIAYAFTPVAAPMEGFQFMPTHT
jgi:hypothetical protein